MIIRSLCSGPVETNAYLIVDPDSRTAVAVDAPMDSADWFVVEAERLGVTISSLWLTHSHWDHTADAAELKRRTGLAIYLHEADEYRLLKPNDHTIFRMPFNLEGASVDAMLHHCDVLSIGTQRWQVRHTPGHTEGGVCFINHEQRVVFAGDTLFHGSVGRTDLPGGDHDTLIRSIVEQLMTLDDDFNVFCGHMDETTIGEERRENPFLHDALASTKQGHHNILQA